MELDALKTTQVAQIDIALCRATLYSALALGFRPPEKETKARLTTQEAVAALAEAAALLDAGGNAGLGAAVKTLAAADASPLEDLVELYRRLFGHSARGAVPPYETEYGAEALFQQPQEMGDLMGFYNAFGLALNGRQHERADHVSCECEFLCFLALKEAYALEHGDDSMLEETRKAERLFLRDHLARFLPAFANKLMRVANPHPIPLPLGEGEGEGDPHRFFRALAELGLRFIVLECARFGVRLGPENLTLRPADDERVPMACGSGECPAMPGVSELDETE
jgi:DMSO reductase family type II enzyme chaperone